MNIILDTSILIDIDRSHEETIVKIDDLRRKYPSPASISFITQFEFLLGIKEKIEKNQEKSRAFVDKFSVLQTTQDTGRHLAALKEKYELPLADLLIATQVLEHGGVLITRDKDFGQIVEIQKIIIANDLEN